MPNGAGEPTPWELARRLEKVEATMVTGELLRMTMKVMEERLQDIQRDQAMILVSQENLANAHENERLAVLTVREDLRIADARRATEVATAAVAAAEVSKALVKRDRRRFAVFGAGLSLFVGLVLWLIPLAVQSAVK